MKFNPPLFQQGFSLLEILMAFSILALSITILLNIFSGGLRRAIVSEEYQRAIIIAQSKLASAGIEDDLQEGVKQGIVDNKFYWKQQVDALDFEPLNILPYQITITVEWLAGEKNRNIELTSIRLSVKK